MGGGHHFRVGLVLRFPFGSIARFSYTAVSLLVASCLLLVRKRSRKQWRESFSIHSPLVMLIAGLPGVGTFAYLTSKPIRSQGRLGRLALDAVGEKIPFRLYKRSGIQRLVAGRATHPDQSGERLHGAGYAGD